MNYNKNITVTKDKISVHDFKGELTTLPEEAFEGVGSVPLLMLDAKNLTTFPKSLDNLVVTDSIRITNNKLKELPLFLQNSKDLVSLEIDAYRMQMDEVLRHFPKLQHLYLATLNRKKMPKAITELEHLKSIRFKEKLEKKINHLDIIKVLSSLKKLKEVIFDFELNLAEIGEEIVLLDKIPKVSVRFIPNDLHLLSIGLLKKCSFGPRYTSPKSAAWFQSLTKEDDLSPIQRKMLFAIYWERLDLLNELMDNPLKNNIEKNPATLYLPARFSNNLNKKIKEYLGHLTLKVKKDLAKADIVIVNSKTTLEVVLEAMRQNQTIATEDHLKEVLTALESPWLREEENESSVLHIQQLILSNQEENILLALQIISGGGATTEILTMVAVLMMAHPDKKVAKESEKLFKKLGSSASYDLIKKSKISLRRSGNSIKKINNLFSLEIGLDEMIFRIVHALVAGGNYNISDMHPGVLSLNGGTFDEPIPSLISDCHQLKAVNLQKTKGIEIKASLEALGKLEHLKSLDLSGCAYEIGDEIAQLTQVETLNLTSNTIANSSDLKSLVNLKWLSVEGCKITDWDFINHLPNLKYLHVGRNQLKTIPESILKHPSLDKLVLKQNKIKAIPKELADGAFRMLDLSNNLIEEIDYKLFEIKSLDELLLRSNKIKNFHSELVKSKSSLRSLNLASNALEEFKIAPASFPNLWKLDLSKNKLTALDDSIFTATHISNLQASNNQISELPKAMSNRRFTYLFLQNNELTKLPEFISRMTIENLDLRNNKIAWIPPALVNRKGDYSRLYWKLTGNPISRIPYR